MTSFKTLDIRGQSFFTSLELTKKAFTRITENGILEVILDKKQTYIDAFKNFFVSKGYKTSGMDADNLMVRLFIKKAKPTRRR